MEFERYSFVILRRGPRAAAFAGEELDRLQEAHLAHLVALREQGHLLAAGPFDDQPDESFRGIAIYGTGLEETRRLAEQDPAVQAGRLAVDVMSWYVPAGELRFGAS